MSQPFVFFFLTLVTLAANAQDRAEIQSFLARFQKNPAAAMGEVPVKKDPRTGRPVPMQTLFEPEFIETMDYVNKKDSYRLDICRLVNGRKICVRDMIPGRAPIDFGDNAMDLVDVPASKFVDSIVEMDQKRLMVASLNESPWSDYYWPIYQGGLAHRYGSDEFGNSKSWMTNFNTFSKFDYVADVIKNGPSFVTTSIMSRLSPAEKYDLLIGDKEQTLTQKMWASGREYWDRYKKVEGWMGICHGWAPASYMMPRPEKTVTVMAANGKTKLIFFPSDIKALASLLWATGGRDTKFIGGRCNTKDPKTDENGRVADSECFDNNPGTWHMAVVNQIGIAKRSLVLDATYDYEVWNQPIFSYSYGYFNPQTGKTVTRLKDAMVSMREFTNDKFRKYRQLRSRETRASHVIGVAMKVTYVVETKPSTAATDSSESDALHAVDYIYDLELDENGKILGGEWYTNLHPDFLWTPDPNQSAKSVADDFATGTWTGNGAVPATWREAGQTASSEGQPLAKIVEGLINRSRK